MRKTGNRERRRRDLGEGLRDIKRRENGKKNKKRNNLRLRAKGRSECGTRTGIDGEK